MKTVALLILSNAFMTYAWYGHLKHRSQPLMWAILTSWLVAFFEYCFQVPANRIGYGQFSVTQLKVMQEIITLVVFTVFAMLYLQERWRWNYLYAFACLLGAVFFAFRK
jgi:uncharacterized protein (DUF486 family)